MMYFKVREYENDFPNARVFSSNAPIEKESTVVIPDSYGVPITAIVVEKVEEYIALSNDYEVEPIICVVDMKEYKKRLSDKNKKALVLKKMQDKMGEVKLIESLKKYAEKDDSMRALFKEYESTIERERNQED